MKLAGRVWKQGKKWLVEVPALDLMTQGYSRKDALAMIEDAIFMLVENKNFKIKILKDKGEEFFIKTDHIKHLLALLLKRQRIKNHLSLADVAKQMGTVSKNAFAQYEQAKNEPSLSKMQQLLHAIHPDLELTLMMGK